MKRLFTLAFLFLAFFVKAQTADDIRNIDGLVAWFSADSVHLTTDNHVDTLYDKSGNNRDAIQNTQGKQPQWVESEEFINGQPSLYFDGNDYFISSSNDLFAQPNTLIAVWKADKSNIAVCFTGMATNNRNQLIASSNNYIYAGSILTATTSHSPFNFSLSNVTFNGSSSRMMFNGTIVAQGDVGNYTQKGIVIGAENGGSYGLTGNIAELFFFNGLLSDIDSINITNYLKTKFSDKKLQLGDTTLIQYGYKPIEYTAECDWAQSFLWDDSIASPTVTISDNRQHILTVTDKFGFTHTDTIKVNYPVPSLPTDIFICSGEKATLDATLQGNYTYLWNNGSTQPTIEATNSGSFCVTITDTNGYHWVSDTINVVSDAFSSLKLFGNDTTLCKGDSIAPNLNINSNYSYMWNTNSHECKIAVNTEGRYSIIVTNENGCMAKDSIYIGIKGIVPEVEVSADTAFANESTSFKSLVNISDGSQIVAYKWLFGDGDTGFSQNPTHKYKEPGTYSATLAVTTTSGCNGSSALTAKVMYDRNKLISPVYPIDNQRVFADSVIFKWKPVNGCEHYFLQIAADTKFETLVFSGQTNKTDTTIYGFIEGKTYYWRIRSIDGIFGPSYMFTISSLRNINGLAAWYSADSVHLTNDNHVDTLYDKSGNERHAIQNVEVRQPLMIESIDYINNQPSVYFDGNDFFIGAEDELFSQPNHIFVIWKSNSTSTSVCFSGMGSTNRNQIVSSNNNVYMYAGTILSSAMYKAPFDYTFTIATFNSSNSTLTFNNATITSGNCGNYTQKGIVVGAEPNGSFGLNGNIAEIIFVNGPLFDQDSSLIMDYFRDKYSESLSLDEDIFIDYGFAPIEYTAECDWALSYLWDNSIASPTITIKDNQQHVLTVTDKFGFVSTDNIRVIYPEVEMPPLDTTICQGDTITWNPDLSGPYTYKWSDGSDDKTLKIHEEDKYWVVITDTAGYEWHSDTIFVKVDRFPQQMTLGADTINTCVGDNIYLQNGFSEATKYQWSDGTTTDHLVAKDAGSYTVTASNLRGCVGRDTAYISIMGMAPTVGFDNSSLCATRQIAFTDKSSSNDASKITSYHWDFGDGGISSEMNPTYIYDTSGNFQISYTISCENGCSNILKKNIYVNALPKADFSTSHTCSNTPVLFTSTSNTANGYLTSWQWTINDSTYDVQNPQTTFTQHGQQPIELIVAASNGCTDTLHRNIDILQGPEVDFTYSTPCFNAPIYLTNNSKTILGLTSSYTWESDTTTFSTQKSPHISYKDTSTHQITLTINQIANGCISSLTKDIRVMPNPAPTIMAGTICEGQDAILEGYNLERTSNSKEWLWTIDTIQFTGSHHVSRTFSTKGKHNISLQITDSTGCVATFDTTVSVHETPTASFRSLPTRGPVPFETEFTNTSANADSLLWIFGDGEESANTDACHTYYTDGIYNVQLIASNRFCSDTAQHAIEAIYPKIDIVLVSASAKTDNGQITVSAIVANRSNYDIPNVSILWYDNVGHRISETIADTIKQGKILQYEFVAKIGDARPDRIQYICVSAEPSTAYADDTPSDNEYCIIFNKDKFSICQPKPNPAKDKLAISYILPNDGNVRIELFNHNGDKIGMLYDGQASAGYNVHNFDVGMLKPGVYFYRITSDSGSKTQMLIIER